MNTKKSLGILLDGGAFDKAMREHMAQLIRDYYVFLTDKLGRKPTQTELGDALGMNRWRLARITKGLEIIDVFR